MSEEPPIRLPHVAIELDSRTRKARKIERLMQLDTIPGPLRLLEIGAGSGGISHYFGTHASGRFQVDAVDVVDSRAIREGFRYTGVTSPMLPFADEAFDVVISNHVIEHVGTTDDQRLHLSELRRVLRVGGVGYIAVPNRWMIVEPHYRIAFLSWLPRRWRTRYLRLMRKGEFYDCEPLQLHEAECLIAGAGLSSRNLTIEAIRATFDIEYPDHWVTRIVRQLPSALFNTARPAIPTLVFKVWR